MGRLQVTIVEAKNLVAKDLGGTSDPYAKLSIGSQSFKTSTVKKSISPVFNQTFVFDQVDHTSDLRVEMYDHDVLTRDDRIGVAVVNLGTLYKGVEADMWTKLQEVARGDVHLKLTAVDFGQSVPQASATSQVPAYAGHQQQYQPLYAPPSGYTASSHSGDAIAGGYMQQPVPQQSYVATVPPPFAPVQYPPQQQPYVGGDIATAAPHAQYSTPGAYPHHNIFAPVMSMQSHTKDDVKRQIDELERIYDAKKKELKSSNIPKEQRKAIKKDMKHEMEKLEDVLKARKKKM